MRFWESPKPFWNKLPRRLAFLSLLPLPPSNRVSTSPAISPASASPLSRGKQICVACLAHIQETLPLNPHSGEAYSCDFVGLRSRCYFSWLSVCWRYHSNRSRLPSRARHPPPLPRFPSLRILLPLPTCSTKPTSKPFLTASFRCSSNAVISPAPPCW